MKHFFISLLFVSTLFSALAQTNDVLLTINNQKITVDEFLRIYNKNKNTALIEDEKSINEYLDLFINYKLKVLEAEALKFDTVSKFNTELNGYIEKLAAPYLIDASVDEKLIQEAYTRMMTDVQSKHILVKLLPSASPEDTLVAYQKAMNIRARILKGEDFSKLAKATSDDPSAKDNGGDIGFVSSFGTLYQYENAIYSLKEGELSMPVRSSAGYHIIKVIKKRPSMGEVQVAHIMITASPQSKEQVDKAKETIDSVYNRLKSGGNFAELAKQYSTDNRTASNGGELSWFDNSWRIPVEFKDQSFKIKNIGEYSEPFMSPFGWHIVKLLGKRNVRPIEEMREIIVSRIAKDPARANLSKDIVLQKLKKSYNYSVNEGVLADFISKVDSTILQGTWLNTISSNGTLCTIGNEKITEANFAQWLQKKQSQQKRIGDKTIYIRMMFDEFTNKALVNYEIIQLPKKNTEFKDLAQEYHDGMLLFEITDAMVWSKSTKDTVGLEKFYKENKSNYMWGERAEVTFYTCKNDTIFADIQPLIEKKIKKNSTPDFILKKINKNDNTNLKIETKLYSKGDNAQIDSYTWTKGNTYTADKKIVVEISNILQPMPKDLKDCRGLVASDYQKQLEDAWLKDLHKKYKIEINNQVLQSIKQ